jgi:predicted nucleotidyltransferase
LSTEPLQLRRLLEHLEDEGVEFILVGGLAVNAWGYLRATRDIDLVPDPSAANLEKLEAVLLALGGKVEVGGDLLAGTAIRTFLRTGDRTLVRTELGRVDVLQGLPQVPGFLALKERAVEVDLDGLVLSVCSLEDLLAMKRASDRPRDRDDVEALDAGRHGSAEDEPNA